MDRKEFLKKFFKTGTTACCCAALLGQGLQAQIIGSGSQNDPKGQEWIGDMEKRMREGSVTPPTNRYKKAASWIKDLMDNMDSTLDPESKTKLMHACGKSCFIDAFGVASNEKPPAQLAERWLAYLKSAGYEVLEEGNVTVVNYSWGREHQNPWGLMIKDGYCMCPIVESIPKGLSPTFCTCSVGFVKEMFQRYMAKPVEVELIESMQMGADDCRFRVKIYN